MIPNFDSVKQIYALNSDDTTGIPTIWIVFELKDQTQQIFATKKEQKAVMSWFEMNLPNLTSILKELLNSNPFEDFLIADIYKA